MAEREFIEFVLTATDLASRKLNAAAAAIEAETRKIENSARGASSGVDDLGRTLDRTGGKAAPVRKDLDQLASDMERTRLEAERTERRMRTLPGAFERFSSALSGNVRALRQHHAAAQTLGDDLNSIDRTAASALIGAERVATTLNRGFDDAIVKVRDFRTQLDLSGRATNAVYTGFNRIAESAQLALGGVEDLGRALVAGSESGGGFDIAGGIGGGITRFRGSIADLRQSFQEAQAPAATFRRSLADIRAELDPAVARLERMDEVIARTPGDLTLMTQTLDANRRSLVAHISSLRSEETEVENFGRRAESLAGTIGRVTGTILRHRTALHNVAVGLGAGLVAATVAVLKFHGAFSALPAVFGSVGASATHFLGIITNVSGLMSTLGTVVTPLLTGALNFLLFPFTSLAALLVGLLGPLSALLFLFGGVGSGVGFGLFSALHDNGKAFKELHDRLSNVGNMFHDLGVTLGQRFLPFLNATLDWAVKFLHYADLLAHMSLGQVIDSLSTRGIAMLEHINRAIYNAIGRPIIQIFDGAFGQAGTRIDHAFAHMFDVWKPLMHKLWDAFTAWFDRQHFEQIGASWAHTITSKVLPVVAGALWDVVLADFKSLNIADKIGAAVGLAIAAAILLNMSGIGPLAVKGGSKLFSVLGGALGGALGGGAAGATAGAATGAATTFTPPVAGAVAAPGVVTVGGGVTVAGGVLSGAALAGVLAIGIEAYFASHAPRLTPEQRLHQLQPNGPTAAPTTGPLTEASLGAARFKGLATATRDQIKSIRDQAHQLVQEALDAARVQLQDVMRGARLSPADILNVERTILQSMGLSAAQTHFGAGQSLIAGRPLAPNEVRTLFTAQANGVRDAVDVILRETHRVPSNVVIRFLADHKRASDAIAAYITVFHKLPNRHVLKVLDNIPTVAIPNVERYILKTGKMPKKHELTVLIKGAEKAAAKVQQLHDQIIQRIGMDHHIGIDTNTDPVLLKLKGLRTNAESLFTKANFHAGTNLTNAMANQITAGAGKVNTAILNAVKNADASAQSYFNQHPLHPIIAGPVRHGATGMIVTGGTPGQDSVPAMLTPGEVVLNRAAVALLGGAQAANTFNFAPANALAALVERLHGAVSGFSVGGIVHREQRDRAFLSLLTQPSYARFASGGIVTARPAPAAAAASGAQVQVGPIYTQSPQIDIDYVRRALELSLGAFA